jgi:Bor protein
MIIERQSGRRIMSALLRILGTASLVAVGACYHATVETGATPSNLVIDKSFASSWIYGLVPPETVTTTSKCPHGPAKVETQHTFVNQLVGFLTLGIYTPMQIRVTCAA